MPFHMSDSFHNSTKVPSRSWTSNPLHALLAVRPPVYARPRELVNVPLGSQAYLASRVHPDFLNPNANPALRTARLAMTASMVREGV